jgi:hypothetical protein
MTKPVGGRGKRAPYNTVVLRVPEPLVSHLEEQVEEYRKVVLNDDEVNWDFYLKNKAVIVKTDLLEATVQAKKILRSKISKEKSIAKLLQVIYGVEVDYEDLK